MQGNDPCRGIIPAVACTVWCVCLVLGAWSGQRQLVAGATTDTYLLLLYNNSGMITSDSELTTSDSGSSNCTRLEADVGDEKRKFGVDGEELTINWGKGRLMSYQKEEAASVSQFFLQIGWSSRAVAGCMLTLLPVQIQLTSGHRIFGNEYRQLCTSTCLVEAESFRAKVFLGMRKTRKKRVVLN